VVINTVSHIGNYGVQLESEEESANVKISGMICNSFADVYSRTTADFSLQTYFEKANIVGISEIDTRQVVRYIRNKGVMNCIISSEINELDALKAELAKCPSMDGLELSSVVSTAIPYFMGNESGKYKVAVMDYGIKKSILSNLTDRGCYCKVFPAKTSFEEVMAWNPDGFFISNGPGDPSAMPYAVETVAKFIATGKPLFGICLGHQLLSLASGISTYKMFNGHRGLNHPVKNLRTGLSEITSQNHGFAVNPEEVMSFDNVEVTHVNLND
jgi:carbamoyl-phosphate synthase small subunit